jgi:malonyl-CoA decarboxylase
LKSLRDVAASAFQRLRPGSADLSAHDLERLREEMAACIEGRGGDVATRTRAGNIAARYLALSPLGRRPVLEMIASFDVDREAVDAALAARNGAADDAERMAAERHLREQLAPARIALLRAFNTPPGGVKFLVDLRAELLALDAADPLLDALEADLKDVLADWFDVGFLQIRQITWDAPASLLEKLAKYEAVHEIRGWADLKNRLDADRRCYAFLHPAMPDEPLIFIEVALTHEMSGEMRPLLDTGAPTGDATHPTHAIFYSISNCQQGLAGISLGNALIKRVVSELSAEFRSLRTFATLSPIPRFRAWLEAHGTAAGSETQPLRRVLVSRHWYRDEALAASLRDPLMPLCAHYLYEAKRPSGAALDPVAHFHLSNGARLERVNWLADTSPKGLRESAGMMANYLYQPDRIEHNQERYASEGHIDASPQVQGLLTRRAGAPARR